MSASRAVRLGVCLVALALVLARLPGLAARQAAPARPGTAFILGQVVDAETGRPISGATVTLGDPRQLGPTEDIVGAAGRAGNLILTGADGQYLFRDLTKGTYRVLASAPGYVSGAAGQKRISGPSRPIHVEDGGHVNDGPIRLWKLATIAGRVIDESGDPVVGTGVRALRAQWVGTSRSFTSAGATQTDDRGSYRIAGLVPDDYVVVIPQTTSTMPMAVNDAYMAAIMSGTRNDLTRDLDASDGVFFGGSGMRIGDLQVASIGGTRVPPLLAQGDSTHLLAYATTFYPSALNSSDATIVTLSSGQEVGGVDLQLRIGPTLRVSGAVTGVEPGHIVGVRLVRVSDSRVEQANGLQTAIASTDAQGAFTFLGVTPGQYVAQVQRVVRPQDGGPPGAAAPSSDPIDQGLFGLATIVVSDRDVDNVELALHPGGRVSGRAVFDGAAAQPTAAQLGDLTVYLTNIDTRQTTPSVRVRPDGQFTIPGAAPGRYFVTVNGTAPVGWSLQNPSLGGRNTDVEPLDLREDVSGVVLNFTDQPTEVLGTVRPSGAAPTSELEVAVIAFPASATAWMEQGMNTRLMRSAGATKQGTFSLSNLAPGDYLIAAVNAAEVRDPRDGRWLQALARVATPFTLKAHDKKTLDLTLVQVR